MDNRNRDDSAQLARGEWAYTPTGLDMQGSETNFTGLSEDDLSQTYLLIDDMHDE